ncbi:serine protease [Maricaulis sp.]|uniref:S1 family peptidase n=1 Tax=Maricaulis sp. TaxID=1486257 RepID=UPI00261E7973|nr:serine protease [Maricaulis sp.]MDF1770294.1 serine protease [Maricaulis sp.]
MELTVAEQLLYSTTKLTSCKNGIPISTGTGFFMRFPFKDETSIIVIITNKHVLYDATEVIVTLHIASNDKPSGKFTTYKLENLRQLSIFHPDDNVDLCAFMIGPTLNQAFNSGMKIFFAPLESNLIPTGDDWEYFDAIEEVIMIGCPNGIYDEANNLPIMRRGITASALTKKYNGMNEFMVDIACFPGSSGSPIFLYDRNGYFDRKKNSYMLGSSRLKLVGILYSGPLVTNDGQIVLGRAPRITVDSMMHLGNALRSTEILKIQEEIDKITRKNEI